LTGLRFDWHKLATVAASAAVAEENPFATSDGRRLMDFTEDHTVTMKDAAGTVKDPNEPFAWPWSGHLKKSFDRNLKELPQEFHEHEYENLREYCMELR
jgi:hypothetical protein